MRARTGRNEPCPCGSGRKYKKCHLEIDRQVERASRGERMTTREKNLLLVTEAADIFGFTRGVTWDDLRKNLSADQVRKLYEVVGSLWPPGVDVTEYLPEPGSHLRALYLGDIHPQKLARNVTRFGLYADEILVIDPLRSPWAFSEEFSPILHPEIWKADTLKIAYFLGFMAPWVAAGLAQIIPSPADYDGAIREATWQAAERRMKGPEMAEILADTSDVQDWGLEEWGGHLPECRAKLLRQASVSECRICPQMRSKACWRIWNGDAKRTLSCSISRPPRKDKFSSVDPGLTLNSRFTSHISPARFRIRTCGGEDENCSWCEISFPRQPNRGRRSAKRSILWILSS